MGSLDVSCTEARISIVVQSSIPWHGHDSEVSVPKCNIVCMLSLLDSPHLGCEQRPQTHALTVVM